MQNEASSAQQLGTVVDPAPEEHSCLDCGVDISHRRRDAQRCEPCSKVRDKQRKGTTAYRQRRRQKYREKTGYNPEGRTCDDCGADISHRGHNAKRCVPCSKVLNNERKRKDYLANRTAVIEQAKDYYWDNRQRVLQRIKSQQQTPESKQRRQKWEENNPEKFQVYRQREKQKHREKTGYNPEGRTCEDCNADISQRGHNTKKCVPCSTLPARKCKECDNDIGKRGTSKFCSEDCKQRHQQSKELQGYTKTCTKCNETKEHTEFGLHSGRRRSRCKSCEVKEASEWFHNSTPQQMTRRLRLRRERERDKRANQSPEQRVMARTKARKANRRSKYGFDIDEDRLYSEQEGKCAICRKSKSLEKLELDHDHETGRLRGFLCKNCNFKLLPRYERFPPQRQDSPYLNAYLSRGKLQ